jgi:cytoskeletal protein CcmA (bactofilin family)
MFDKKPKSYTDLLGKTNRIVEGTIIKGNISSLADFRLDGELIGNFFSESKIVIGPAGSVTGDVNCQNADIEGTFDGKMQVTELLSIKSKANIHGQVSVGKLAIEPGANFTASCDMKTDSNNFTTNDGQESQPQKD